MITNKLPLPIRAFVGLMLLSAVLHLIVLFVYFIKTHDGVPLNFYSIIGATLFLPELANSSFSLLGSSITTAVLYCLIFMYFKHESRHSR